MIRFIFLVPACLMVFLAGCSGYTPMTREETVAAMDYCHEHGYSIAIVRNVYEEIIDVQCSFAEEDTVAPPGFSGPDLTNYGPTNEHL